MKLFEKIQMRWVILIWNLTPHCAEMAKLSSLSLDRALPFRTRLKMRLHLLICVWCKRYLRQLRFMHNAAWQLQEEWMLVSNRRLSPQARERLKQALREFHEH